MPHRVIHLHPEAPAKPAEAQPCNGCGVCCAAEPCPLGMLLSVRRRGGCTMLRWAPGEGRYRCGALAAAPQAAKFLIRRWIGAGAGCDSDLLALPADRA
jgi:hypothetical protein